MTLKPQDHIRQEALKDKSEEEQLEMLAHFALVDLSNYYNRQNSKNQYEVNKLLHRLGEISK